MSELKLRPPKHIYETGSSGERGWETTREKQIPHPAELRGFGMTRGQWRMARPARDAGATVGEPTRYYRVRQQTRRGHAPIPLPG
jgi:hypothetical protein